MTIVSVPPNPATVDENGVRDVDLSFGTRATFSGVQTSSVLCDDTVLVEGSVSCP